MEERAFYMKDENMLENFIHAFRNKYDYDEIDEKYFDNPLLVEKVSECIQDYEDEEIPAEIMADVVYKTLYFLQYGDTLDSDDLQDRFPDGR